MNAAPDWQTRSMECHSRGLVVACPPERLVQRLSVPPGKGLQVLGAAATTQDPEHRDQQQEALRVTHPTPVPTIGDGPEEADQVIRCGPIACERVGFGHWGH
jgi:hypothetical protein